MKSGLQYDPGIGDNNGEAADQQSSSSLKQSSPNDFNTHSSLDLNETENSSQDRKNISQDTRATNYAPVMGPAEARGCSAGQRRNSFQDTTDFGHANRFKLPGCEMVIIITF